MPPHPQDGHPPCSCWRACWPPPRSRPSGWFSPRSSRRPPPSAAGSRAAGTRLRARRGRQGAQDHPLSPPQHPKTQHSPTCVAAGPMLVVAQVAQVPLHVVDGSAAVVAEGAPAQGVTVSTGLGGLGDVLGEGNGVGVTPGLQPDGGLQRGKPGGLGWRSPNPMGGRGSHSGARMGPPQGGKGGSQSGVRMGHPQGGCKGGDPRVG